MIEVEKYETMTQHDLIEILNHWEQLAFQKTNEVERLQRKNILLKNELKAAKHGWNRTATRSEECKLELLAEVERLREGIKEIAEIMGDPTIMQTDIRGLKVRDALMELIE